MERKPTAGRELGLQLHSMEVSSADKFDSAFKDATQARSTALAVIQSPFTSTYQKQIADLARKIGCRRYTLGKILSPVVA